MAGNSSRQSPLKSCIFTLAKAVIRWMSAQPDRGTTATVARELESESHGRFFFETLC